MKSMFHRLLNLRTLLLVHCIALLNALPAQALPEAEPQGMYRYELRAFGALAGEALLTIGEPTLLKDGPLRRVRIEARTAGAAARIFEAEGDGTSLVNHRFLPLRMKWKATIRGRLRQAEDSMNAGGMEGQYQYGTKAPRPIKQSCDTWPLDAVSAYLWLPQQDLSPGKEYRRPFFNGKSMGELVAEVGKVQSIQVPVGLREVVPMRISAGREGKKRRVTFWVGVKDRILYRIDVAHGVLGIVRAELVGVRRPKQG